MDKDASLNRQSCCNGQKYLLDKVPVFVSDRSRFCIGYIKLMYYIETCSIEQKNWTDKVVVDAR